MKILKKLALVALATMLVNCGDAEKKEKDEVKLKSNNSATTSSKKESDVTEVVLLATDQMQFNKTEIRVPAGKPITLTLRHTGTMDVKVMGHNFVLLKKDTEIPAFANAAAGAAENEYIPDGTEAVIVHTKLLGGGQSDTIDFDAPEPGTYDFICSFPGHYALMKGKFIVE